MSRDEILAKGRDFNALLSNWLDRSRDPLSEVWDQMAQLHDELSESIGRVERAIERDPAEQREEAAELANNDHLSSAQACGR